MFAIQQVFPKIFWLWLDLDRIVHFENWIWIVNHIFVIDLDWSDNRQNMDWQSKKMDWQSKKSDWATACLFYFIDSLSYFSRLIFDILVSSRNAIEMITSFYLLLYRLTDFHMNGLLKPEMTNLSTTINPEVHSILQIISELENMLKIQPRTKWTILFCQPEVGKVTSTTWTPQSFKPCWMSLNPGMPSTTMPCFGQVNVFLCNQKGLAFLLPHVKVYPNNNYKLQI